MREIPSSPEVVVVCGEFDAFSTRELFEYWTVPELLLRWWPNEAEVQPWVGGRYAFTWPELGWRLDGEYMAFEPGRHLGFGWNWSHEPAPDRPRKVDVWFMPAAGGGARMAIYHGPYAAYEEESRQGALEGWIHFGMRLAGLRDEAPDA